MHHSCDVYPADLDGGATFHIRPAQKVHPGGTFTPTTMNEVCVVFCLPASGPVQLLHGFPGCVVLESHSHVVAMVGMRLPTEDGGFQYPHGLYRGGQCQLYRPKFRIGRRAARPQQERFTQRTFELLELYL